MHPPSQEHRPDAKSGNRAEFAILAFEASARLAAAAVRTHEGRATQSLVEQKHGHAGPITGLALAAMEECGVRPGGITHVAAGRGPGSFTGIRVALAAAKGFCIATGARGVGVSCLAAMVHESVPGTGGSMDPQEDSRGLAGKVIATQDTRRGSYFAQCFSAKTEAISDILEIDPERPVPMEAGWHGARIIGEGAEAIALAHPEARLDVCRAGSPLDASSIAGLAASRLAAGHQGEPLKPIYVVPPIVGRPRRDASRG